ncbi:FIVAR domain-containing protein [Gardnerella vaginalis]|uniref:M protein repeat protein n=1 Tax=Gardnerella vaginalis TaxID=2702 RepID=A0A133NPQ5_GARVA|nr:FIVAR domain-containing protein [Gardnerella vaginalis]KXA18247.1 M protein repeat protein [Gardnerella vaginalis]
MTTKSGKHTNKIAKNTLNSADNNGVIKAVDMRKVAALSAGAAGVIAGAAIAFCATPAMAAETTSAPVKTSNAANEQDLTANKKAEGAKAEDEAKAEGAKETEADASKKTETSDKADSKANKNETELAGDGAANGSTNAADVVDQQAESGNKSAGSTTGDAEGSASADANKQGAVKEDSGAKVRGKRSLSDAQPTDEAVGGEDREVTSQPDPGPQAKSEITLSKETKDTLPNLYAWGSSDNVYIEEGQNQSVTITLKPSDGVHVTKVAIFPNDNIDISNKNAKGFSEYNSADPEWHQSYSGEYSLATNPDGSVTLTMSKLYRKGTINGAQGYAANRSIYAYGVKGGQEVLLYKTNIVRAATIIPPKKTGSIVLQYDEKLTEDQIRARLKEALGAPTAAKDGKSVREQIKDASQAYGVGVRKEESKPVVNTTDDPDKKIVITDKRAYDVTQFNRINTVTSKNTDTVTTYTTGVQNLKTYLVSDLGYKSGELALTVARYDTRIDKPVVTDPNNISADVKNEIAKKLANLNHIAQDKVTINAEGTVTINFEGVDPSLAPTIKLSDLVLKQLEEKDVKVPTDDKATFVYNPLAYSDAEIKSIKKAIYEANKDNKKLGLSETDYENQISLSYLTGNLTASGHANQGISNGRQENAITVKIKTDKAVAEFKSDITKSKLTKFVNIREDYDVTWNNNRIAGRDSDEGLSWSEDHKTIIYRYDPTKAAAFKSGDVTKLLTATPKTGKEGLRTLTGGEKLDHEGAPGQEKKSHVGYILQNGQPTGELTLGIMKSGYWTGDPQITGTDVNMGDVLAKTDSYTWNDGAEPVKVASKDGKIYRARLFVAPYGMESYQYVYTHPDGKNPNNTPKAINVIFVPQTNHKTSDLQTSIEGHKTTKIDNTDVPTEAKYYNASKDKKDAYDKALQDAKTLYDQVKNTDESKLTEDQKAQIDNATIKLNKARAELDGDNTDKTKLEQSINDHGKAEEGKTPTGTQATNQFKNVSDPDFKTPDGKPDTTKNDNAKKAKEDYDKALEEAKKVKDNTNATQAQVDEAKAKLDEARKKLNDFTTNKDELNNAIAQHGKVNTGDADKQGEEKLKTADPTYQNSTPEQRTAYDNAVTEANKVAADPNASQKEVNEAIKKLKDAKDALDKNATNKAPLDAAVQKSFDNPDPNDATKQSVFYKNAKNKTNDPDAQQAVKNYDDALKEAKRVLGDKKATNADVKKAKKALEDAEAALHADNKYSTDKTALGKALADNFSGYLMPAYFNAFDLAQSKDPADAAKAEQAAKDFKDYNDAYHAAKDLMDKAKKNPNTVTQDEVNEVKDKLIEARKVIDKYATDTSKISAALLHSLAITKSPAYLNASATDATEDAKKAAKAYDDALDALKKAFNDQMDKDKDDKDSEIPESVIPDKTIDMNNANALKKLQQHAKGQPLNRDVKNLLAKLNDAVKGLDKFKTKTDELINSINEDDNTKQTPGYKNTAKPEYKGENGQADTEKNGKAKKAHEDYGQALAEAKAKLNDPAATQKDINDAKDKLDKARKALDDYKTDVSKLQESANKHGKDAKGSDPAVEGTKDSDAYRNASDPHFLKADTTDPTKLVEDTDRNNNAKKAKADYDKALAEAQELLAKHDPKSNTPLDAQPTQDEIDKALKTLDEKRQALDAYATKTDALKTEADLSKADTEGASIDGKFENSPEFKNADAKKDGDNENADVKAYKKALEKARNLVKAATDQGKKNSERPTQQEVDEALDALKKAKQTITDTYKTNVSLLKDAKEFANGDFKKTPEYKNAVVIKGDNSDTQKQSKAKEDVEALDENTNDSALKKAKDILDNPAGKTQKEVDEALKTLQDAMTTVTDGYKTDATPLEKEVGDKDEHGNDVTPPFEATVEYKNALEKAKTEDAATAGADSATKKLEAYNEKLKAAQELINKVKNPDPNAEADSKPTNADVKQALDELKAAKDAITNGFKTNAADLKKEADDKDEHGTAHNPAFESSPEYKNALAKKGNSDKDIEDVQTYKDALKKANDLLSKFDENGNPKSGEKDIPSQQEVDEAQKALKEIKEKILANYKTNPTELNEEVKQSKDGDDDPRDTVFENTPAFKNATAKGDEDAKKDLKDYNDKLTAARNLLKAFDLVNGGVQNPLPAGTKVPTQQELDKALKELQEAKSKIEKDYATQKGDLSTEAADDSNFTKTPEFQNAVGSKEAEEYANALAEANSVLSDKEATQAQVDAALKRLQDAKAALRGKHGTDKSDLRNEAENDPTFRDSIPFLIANSEDIAEYNKALQEANAVLADPNATQAEVDAALRKLQLAKQKIMDFYNSLGSFGNGGSGYVGTGFGVGAAAVDKSMLIVEVNGALADIANGVNANASANAANAAAVISEFNAALQNARAVLANPNATQAQVDAALNRLRAARAALAALNAADADRGGSSRGSLSVQTGVDSATLSAFAAMFVGLAGLGVSAKRRKHASK